MYRSGCIWMVGTHVATALAHKGRPGGRRRTCCTHPTHARRRAGGKEHRNRKLRYMNRLTARCPDVATALAHKGRPGGRRRTCCTHPTHARRRAGGKEHRNRKLRYMNRLTARCPERGWRRRSHAAANAQLCGLAASGSLLRRHEPEL